MDEFRAQGALGFKLGLECVEQGKPRPEVFLLAEKAAEHGVPLLCHCFDRSRHDSRQVNELTPAGLATVARAVPQARLVMAHCGLRYHRALPLVADFPNVSADISGTPCYADMLPTALRTLGSRRVLYGSDFPARLMWSQLAKTEAPGVSTPDRERVLFANACEHFGL